jgi:hypothetical protein
METVQMEGGYQISHAELPKVHLHLRLDDEISHDKIHQTAILDGKIQIPLLIGIDIQ